jgi:hypothetical protein
VRRARMDTCACMVPSVVHDSCECSGGSARPGALEGLHAPLQYWLQHRLQYDVARPGSLDELQGWSWANDLGCSCAMLGCSCAMLGCSDDWQAVGWCTWGRPTMRKGA